MKELSLNILDIVQNSIRAGAGEISIIIDESETTDRYRITIKDDGSGMPEAMLKNVTNPFFTTRTKRKMGLGLSLLKYHAEITGGGLTISSETGSGTIVTATFSYKHIDRQPLGDITGVLVMMMAANENINFIYSHSTETGEYRISSKETREYLEIESLGDRILLEEIRCIIGENLTVINASGIDLKRSLTTNL